MVQLHPTDISTLYATIDLPNKHHKSSLPTRLHSVEVHVVRI
jgi:hypothetical protein